MTTDLNHLIQAEKTDFLAVLNPDLIPDCAALMVGAYSFVHLSKHSATAAFVTKTSLFWQFLDFCRLFAKSRQKCTEFEAERTVSYQPQGILVPRWAPWCGRLATYQMSRDKVGRFNCQWQPLQDVFTLLTRTQHNSTTLRFDFFWITGEIGELGCPK